jgi:hypothetical protein
MQDQAAIERDQLQIDACVALFVCNRFVLVVSLVYK